MTSDDIRKRLALARRRVEISVMDPEACPKTEWWLQPRREPCPACAGTGRSLIEFGDTVVGSTPCPQGCTGHPSD